MIRNTIKNDTRNIVCTTTSISTDNEFLAALGKYELKYSNGNSTGNGKYLVVWKKENGDWKLFRDISL